MSRLRASTGARRRRPSEARGPEAWIAVTFGGRELTSGHVRAVAEASECAQASGEGRLAYHHAFGMYDYPNGEHEPGRHTRSAIRNLRYAPVDDQVVDTILNSCQIRIEDTRPGVNDMWSGWLAEVTLGQARGGTGVTHR